MSTERTFINLSFDIPIFSYTNLPFSFSIQVLVDDDGDRYKVTVVGCLNDKKTYEATKFVHK